MKKLAILTTVLAMTTAILSGCSGETSTDTESSSSETVSTAETNSVSIEETAEDEENYDTGDASLDNIRNQDEIG